MKWFFVFLGFINIGFIIYSYAYIDPGLHLTEDTYLQQLFFGLNEAYVSNRLWFAFAYWVFVSFLFGIYCYVLYHRNCSITIKHIVIVLFVLIFSYPAFSYDLFNYIATSKVLFHYHENPYIVMPIEIPNEPNLLFTRASNKVALYGPVWIAFTAVPYFIGMNSIWVTIIVYKFTNYCLYLLICFLLWKQTKHIQQVLFFCLNPLVIIETFVSGHNDLFMMVFATLGLFLYQMKGYKKFFGLLLIMLSIFTKGATALYMPILFLAKHRSFWKFVSILMFIIFLLTPLREEMYPWYAIWFLVPLSFVPWHEWRHVRIASILLSYGLLLRYIPYIATYNYGGYGPVIRTSVTIIPLSCYFAYLVIKNIWQVAIIKKHIKYDYPIFKKSR